MEIECVDVTTAVFSTEVHGTHYQKGMQKGSTIVQRTCDDREQMPFEMAMELLIVFNC